MGYRVVYRNPVFVDARQALQVITTTIEMAIITGLHPGVIYNFTIVAFNGIGDSDPSIIASVTTQNEGTLVRMKLLTNNLQEFITAMKFYRSYCFVSAPSDYPQNLSSVTLSSTEIAVNWNEVPAIGQNGIIITYEVQYEPLMILSGALTINSSNTSTLLRDLQEYTEYNITVRAYTSVGPGPLNPGVTDRTFEDGKL